MSNINKINYKGTPYDIEDKTAREGLTSKQDTLVSQTNIKSINTHSLLEAGDLQIFLSECNNDTGFITRLVSDLENYYDKTKVDEMISAIPKFSIKVVEQLPTENISDTTVYLVKDINVEGNLYTEWIHVSGVWEQLGMQNVDLKGYATEKWVQDQSYDTIANVDIKLNDKADKQETSNQLAGKLDKISESDKVYATTGLGDQTSLQYNVEPIGDGLVKRTSDGQIKATDPIEDNDAVTKKCMDAALLSKQNNLIGTEVEGQNIKTINGESLLGTGNITITGGGGSEITVDAELSDTSINPVQNKIINAALKNKVIFKDWTV